MHIPLNPIHADQTSVQIELKLYWKENSLDCEAFMVSKYIAKGPRLEEVMFYRWSALYITLPLPLKYTGLTTCNHCSCVMYACIYMPCYRDKFLQSQLPLN